MKHNYIEKKLNQIDEYLLSIKRNLNDSCYELEVGFRKNWAYKSTKNIQCEVLSEGSNGSLVKIIPKHSEVTVDDLIFYVEKVIETNKKITKMEEEMEKKLAERKKELEDEICKYQEELENFKKRSLSDEDEIEENTDKKDVDENEKKSDKENTDKKDVDEDSNIEEDIVQKIS